MHHEIGSAAGIIWTHLREKGESSVAQLKKSTKLQAPIFEWAIGWLAREDAIVIAHQKNSFRIRLK